MSGLLGDIAGGMLIGVIVAAIGLYLLAISFRSRDETGGFVNIPYLGTLSTPTGTTLALVLIFIGYHIFAYESPEDLLVFSIPERFRWFVYGGGVLAVVGALFADRLDRRDETGGRNQP